MKKPFLSIALLLYTNNLKNRFLTASIMPHIFCSCLRFASRQWSLDLNKKSEVPSCQIPDSSSCLCIFVVSSIFSYLHFDERMWWWLGVGGMMGIALFLLALSFEKKEIVPKTNYEGEIASFQAQLKLAHANVEKGVIEQAKLSESLHKKIQTAQEKCNSYKKLVDIHQLEIDKLHQENQTMSQEVLTKTRRIAELEFCLEDPKEGAQELQILYHQLKKQFEEKSHLLDQAHAELMELENNFSILQKEHEQKTQESSTSEKSLTEKLTQVEQERQKLEAELQTVQTRTLELSLKKQKTPRKKSGKVSNEKSSRPLA